MGQLLRSGDSNGGERHASTGSGSGEVEGASSRGGRWQRLFVILTQRISHGDALRLRRGWLRFLDALLAGEIRAVGALDLHELADAAPRILHCDKDRIRVETIEEWWEFAWRRGWLERAGRRCRLTETARADLRAERERVNSPDPRLLARGLIPIAAGAAGLLSRNLEVEAAILIVAAAIVVSLLLIAAVLRLIEPPFDRWLARLACDSLEGRLETRRLQTEQTWSPPKRLYDPGDFESPGLAPSGPAPPHWWRHLLGTRDG